MASGIGSAAVEGMIAIGKIFFTVVFWIGVGIYKYATRHKDTWSN